MFTALFFKGVWVEKAFLEYSRIGFFRMFYFSLKESYDHCQSKFLYVYCLFWFVVLGCLSVFHGEWHKVTAVVFFELAFLYEFFKGLDGSLKDFCVRANVSHDVFKFVNHVPFSRAIDRSGVDAANFRFVVAGLNDWASVYSLRKGVFEKPFMILVFSVMLGVVGGVFSSFLWQIVVDSKFALSVIGVIVIFAMLLMFFGGFASAVVDIKHDKMFFLALIKARIEDDVE